MENESGSAHVVWLSGSGIAALFLIAFLTTVGVSRINNVVSQIQISNDLARVSSCKQQNDSTAHLRRAFRDSVESVRQPGPPNPQLDRFIMEYLDRVNRNLRDRDCSRSGIAAYLARPPADVPCDPDGTGFCK